MVGDHLRSDGGTIAACDFQVVCCGVGSEPPGWLGDLAAAGGLSAGGIHWGSCWPSLPPCPLLLKLKLELSPPLAARLLRITVSVCCGGRDAGGVAVTLIAVIGSLEAWAVRDLPMGEPNGVCSACMQQLQIC